MKQKLTQEYLKEALTYDPENGIFTWNTRPLSHFENAHRCNLCNSRDSGMECGYYHIASGYRVININGKPYKAHRLAFLYTEGYLPENDVDHINRIKDDNRWINLREISHQCNMQNCNISKNNTSGVCGVSWDKSKDKWEVKIMIDGRYKHIGRFKNFEDAVMARYQEEVSNPRWTCSVESTAYKYLKERNLI